MNPLENYPSVSNLGLCRLYSVDRMTSEGSSAASAATGVLSSRVWRDSQSTQRSRQLCVQPHQRINLTLVDFSVDGGPTAPLGQVRVIEINITIVVKTSINVFMFE